MTTTRRTISRPSSERRSRNVRGTACRRASGCAPRRGRRLPARESTIETVRPDGARQRFALRIGARLSGIDRRDPGTARVHGASEHRRAKATPSRSKSTSTRTARRERDNNMRAAVVHVIADAAVSVLVIVGLLLARAFGWLWMDPLAGIIGALVVIASWSYGADPRHRRDPARHESRRPLWRTICARPSRATATSSPTCICGGWGRAISGAICVGRHDDPAARRFYRQRLANFQVAVASDHRGFA